MVGIFKFIAALVICVQVGFGLPADGVALNITGSVVPEPVPASASAAWAEESVKVHFLDVGQADSIYIQLPDDKDILIAHQLVDLAESGHRAGSNQGVGADLAAQTLDGHEGVRLVESALDGPHPLRMEPQSEIHPSLVDVVEAQPPQHRRRVEQLDRNAV